MPTNLIETTDLPDTPIPDPTRELGYVAKRSGLWVMGKQSAEAVGESIAHTLESSISPQGFNQISAVAGALNGSVATLATIGVAGGVSAILTEMDHNHRKDNLKDLYKEELSIKLNKPQSRLVRADLNEMAKTNGVIRQELDRNRKQRNFGVVLSFIASMASLAVITLALPAVLGAVISAGMPVAAEAALGTVGGMLLKAGVGLCTYHLVKDPLHALADKLFHIDEKTPNDYIVGIKRERDQGRVISREQVLSVFVASHPELDRYIVAEYGRHFDELSVQDKQKAAGELNQYLPLDKLAIEISSGKVNATELAFAVEGEASGVNHEKFAPEPAKPGLLVSMVKGLGSMLGFRRHHDDHPQHDHDARVQAVAHVTAVAAAQQQRMPEKHAHQGHTMTHVEHLEQARAVEAASMHQGIPG
jgi:hypothetical protein